VEALRQRLEAVELHTGIQAHLVVDRPLHLPAVVEEGLYRICQEALNNTLKHALATEVTVQLFCAERAVHLSVEDNGVGFDVHDLRVLNGVGIRTIRERVRLMNANFSIVAAPQQGAHLHVWLAVPAAAAAYGEDPADLSVERGATWPK
jgi:signal transduction histidine kinase